MTDRNSIDAEAHMTEVPGKTPAKSKHGLIVAGVIVVAMLMGAAFIGGQLLNRSNMPAEGGNMMLSGPGGEQTVSVQIERSKELPDAEPDVVGLYSRRVDQSLFVTDANLDRMMVMIDDKGKVTTSSEGSGQTIEIVVTKDTQLYRDATAPDPSQPMQGGAIQQKLEPGSLDEVGENSIIMAWGERRGERLVASVLMYSKPIIFKMPQ
jgi:hypothetical protein